MLGIKANGEHINRDAVFTGIIVFLVNLLESLPQGRLPLPVEIYTSIIRALAITLTIWCINHGIQWKTTRESE